MIFGCARKKAVYYRGDRLFLNCSLSFVFRPIFAARNGTRIIYKKRIRKECLPFYKEYIMYIVSHLHFCLDVFLLADAFLWVDTYIFIHP